MTELLHGDGAIRRTTPYGSSIENTYAGVLSFMRRNYSRALDGVDVAISGVPLDLATTYRSGARLAGRDPRGERAARGASSVSVGLQPVRRSRGRRLRRLLVRRAQPAVDQARDRRACAHDPRFRREDADARRRPLHHVPLLVAHERYGKPLSLIHFDAHCDTWADDDPDSLNHGTMFKAVKEGLIDPATSVQVGIRTWNDDFRDRAARCGVGA